MAFCPFGAVITELFFIMSSTWNHEFYYLFGFLSLVLLIVLITCAEISIALTYCQLTSEDYRWWWTSFSASGSSGLYVFLYSIMYFNSRFQIRHWVSVLMYFGYMFIMSCIFGLMSGAGRFLQHLRLRAWYLWVHQDWERPNDRLPGMAGMWHPPAGCRDAFGWGRTAKAKLGGTDDFQQQTLPAKK